MDDPNDQSDAPAPEDEAHQEPNPEFDSLYDDPVLQPPDTRSPEEQAFWEDLKNAYTNPDIFHDPTQRQVFILPIRSLFLSDNPMLIYSEINGEVFPAHFVEMVKNLTLQNPHLDDELRKYGETLEQYLDGLVNDPEMAEFIDGTWKFLLRHFPRFLMSAFYIAALSAVTHNTLVKWRQQPDSQLNKMEKTASDILKTQLAAFEKMVKQLVETRSAVGRPKIVYGEGELPEIVRNVLKAAYELMGEARGKDAAPGLKAVAIKLGTNEGALSRRLRLAGHPWTGIRTWLENRPSDPTNGRASMNVGE